MHTVSLDRPTSQSRAVFIFAFFYFHRFCVTVDLLSKNKISLDRSQQPNSLKSLSPRRNNRCLLPCLGSRPLVQWRCGTSKQLFSHWWVQCWETTPARDRTSVRMSCHARSAATRLLPSPTTSSVLQVSADRMADAISSRPISMSGTGLSAWLAQQRCGRSRQPALLRCWDSQARISRIRDFWF